MINTINNTIYFSGNGNHSLGKKIIGNLNEISGCHVDFSHIMYGKFSDGEPDDKFSNYEDITGKNIVLYQSMSTERMMVEFVELCWALKHQYDAKNIIGVVPFLRYRRQDHPENKKEINRLRMLLELMKYSGLTHLIVGTPHSGQMAKNCQELGIKFQAAEFTKVLAQTIETFIIGNNGKIFVYAPDKGSVHRAVALARQLELPVRFSLKERGFDNVAKIVEANEKIIQEATKNFRQKYNFNNLEYAKAEDIFDSTILMVEDEISSCNTAKKTGVLLKSLGAKKIILAATHAVCVPGWQRTLLSDNPFFKIIIGDSIYRDYENRTGGQMYDVSIAGTMAAILYGMLMELKQN